MLSLLEFAALLFAWDILSSTFNVVVGFVFYLWNIFALKILVVSIFDLTDSTANQGVHFGYLWPFGANAVEHHEDELIFFTGPFSSNDGRVDHIVPPLTALAAESSRQVSSDHHPVLGTVLLHLLFEDVVFVAGPLGAAADLGLQRRGLHRCSSGLVLLTLRALRESFFLLELSPLWCRLVDFLQIQPPLEASNLGFVWHEFAQAVPWLVAVDVYESAKLLVFFRGPYDLLMRCLADPGSLLAHIPIRGVLTIRILLFLFMDRIHKLLRLINVIYTVI